MTSRSLRRMCILAVVAISLVTHEKASFADCKRDGDCKAGRSCVSGTCQRVKKCRADADCPGALVCEKRRCVTEDPPAIDPEPVGVDSSDSGPATDAAQPHGDTSTFDAEWAGAKPARPAGQRRSTCASCATGDYRSAWAVAFAALLLLARRRRIRP